MELDLRAERYIEDIRWVQQDILKLPKQYPSYPIEYCEIFSERIKNTKYTQSDREKLFDNLQQLQMILQGPFWLGDDIVVGGFWNKKDTVRQTFNKTLPSSLKGKRILEIGSMSGYDSFFINLKNPEYYLSIEPSGYHYQAKFLNTIYGTKIDFKQWFWQDIPEDLKGTFDIVLNCGCLYHEYDFISMIKKTTDLLKIGGETIVATTVIRDKSHSDFIKYMPETYAGDMTYWFAIGEKALMRLYKSFGCEGKLILEAGAPGDSGNGKTTVEGHPLEKYNFYKFVKTESKSRVLSTIPRY